jgi:hypothetical protein
VGVSFEWGAGVWQSKRLQCSHVPDAGARCRQTVRLLIGQCNEVVFSVGEDTGGAGAGHQEGAVPQRREDFYVLLIHTSS